jgi:2-polyprenyl-3-methyl-5-hydroxy-6-metoxy-1,4-benzoquinol methylase
MSSVHDHYASLLAPLYSWMAGGAEAAISRGEAELESLGLTPRSTAIAVDLGAGFGMHSIPMARRGYSVVAVDSSAELLRELQAHAGNLPIRTVKADLLSFPDHLARRAEAILCMGDTLTHLSSKQAVQSLFSKVAAALAPGGRFVLTFRDYTTPLTGERRFIHVRSDADRILTCFLEYASEHVDVHDLVYEREGTHWIQRVSSYRKVRLAPDWVSTTLRDAGFEVTREAGPSGMIRLVALLDCAGGVTG